MMNGDTFDVVWHLYLSGLAEGNGSLLLDLLLRSPVVCLPGKLEISTRLYGSWQAVKVHFFCCIGTDTWCGGLRIVQIVSVLSVSWFISSSVVLLAEKKQVVSRLRGVKTLKTPSYQTRVHKSVLNIHCVSKKTRHQTLAHNFPKC